MIKYALIGMGRVSPNHLYAAKALENDLKIAAVCDIDPGTMDKTEYNKYTDYRKMILDEKLDLVAIATDSGSHAEIAMFALQNGANVIIEKPIALSMSDADNLIKTAEKYNRVLAVNHQNRFNKSIQKLREAFDAGRFGKVSHIAAHVRWYRDMGYYLSASWRGKWATDGGCLMNQCIHNADLLYWFIGDIDEVFAYTTNAHHPDIEVEDIGAALVKGKNGAIGLFEGTVNIFPADLEETLYIFGDKGTAKVGGSSLNIIEEWQFKDNSDDFKGFGEDHSNVYGHGHLPFYADVVQAIKTNSKPLIDGYEGKRALEIILAMYKSKKTGLPVKLPLADFASIDMI